MDKKFDIPGYTYFIEKNIYSGSINNIFNYKIYPGEKFSVVVWRGKFCLDKTPQKDIIDKKEFDSTREGLDEILAWLDQKHLETLK